MATDANALTDEDWQNHLRRDGYVHFHRLCPETAITSARCAIDHDLATNYDANRQVEYDHRSYCPDLRSTLQSWPYCATAGSWQNWTKLSDLIALNMMVGRLRCAKLATPRSHFHRSRISMGSRRRSTVFPLKSYIATSLLSSGYISLQCGPNSPGTSLCGRAPTTSCKPTSASADPRHCGTACPRSHWVNPCS